MYDYQEIYRRLKRNFHYYKGSPLIRSRAMQLLRVLQAVNNGRSVESAAELQGVRRQYFYFWLRRLIAANYDLQCLKGHSKKPHHSPNATPKSIIAKLKEIRAVDESGQVHCAIAAKAEYIVTGDMDFVSYGKLAEISIITPTEMLRIAQR